MESTKKFRIALMGTFVLVLSAITVAVIFAVDQFNQWQNNQQVIAAILDGDKTAVETLEHSDIEIQLKILETDHVKKSLIDFYLQKIDAAGSLWTKLETYDDAVEANILQNDEVSQMLVAHYFAQINLEIANDSFNKAFSLLDALKNKYPNSKKLSNKYLELQEKKQQRLAKLTQLYMECLDQTLKPLLERTHCMVESRRKIEHVGIEHTLPNDSNLPEMYIEEIKQTLIDKNYEQAEKLLSDWQSLIPTPSEKRNKLQNSLFVHQQVKSIITDLVSYDKEKIMARLNQLTAVTDLQEEVLAMPNIQNNLLRFHLGEALALMTNNSVEVYINPNTRRKLKRILAITDSELTIPTSSNSSQSLPSPGSSIPMAGLLKTCQSHNKANRLTTGKGGTALVCYNKVLQKDPGNVDALLGLRAIESRYKTWADQALQQNKLKKVDTYLNAIKKINPKSRFLLPLQQRLSAARTQSNSKKEKKAPPPKQSVKARRPASKKKKQAPPKQSAKAKPTSKKQNLKCKGCSCSVLIRQLSMGIKPLTAKQKKFVQSQCR